MIATNTPAGKSALLACAALFFVQLSAAVPQPTTPPVVSSREMPAYVTNLATRLPLELVDLLFDLLPPIDVWTTQRICKGWHNRFWSYGQPRREQLTESELVFGPHKWRHYYGLEVTDAPPIPETILQLLDQECHIWPGRKVRDTHLLTLIPKGLTLNQLAELIQRPLNGHVTTYRYYDDYTKNERGDQAVPASYWALMTRHILPDSRSKTLDQHQALVAQQAQRTQVPYAMPKAIEAATSTLTHFVQHGERLYGDDKQDVRGWNDNKQSTWYTYTRCEERVNNNQSPVVVGGFSPAGLCVFFNNVSGWSVYGVAACCALGPGN